MSLVYQCHSCNNNPFHPLFDDGNNDDTVVASNCSPSTPQNILPSSIPPATPPMHQVLCGLTSPPPTSPSTIPPRRLPTTPLPRVQATQAFIPAITPTASYSSVHDLRPVSSQKPLKPLSYTKQQTHFLPIVEPDDERDSTPITRPSSLPRCSTRLISNRTPAISHAKHYITSLTLDLLMPLPSPSLENLPTINIQALLLKSKKTAMV